VPVFAISVAKVRQRADFFLDEASRFCAQRPYSDYGFALSDEDAQFTAEAYYLLSEAYKQKRQITGRTQPSKIAALTAMVVATINPLRPHNPPDRPNIVSTYANPLYALRLGCNIVQHPLHRQHWTRIQWFCDHLRQDAFICLNDYIAAARAVNRTIGSPFEIDISNQELKCIEGRIGFFDVLSELKIFKA
jgi:hypothetical protein